MKRIAIFADGTWNSPDQDFDTNVLRLAQAEKRSKEKKQGIILLTCLAHLETQSLPQDSPWLEDKSKGNILLTNDRHHSERATVVRENLADSLTASKRK